MKPDILVPYDFSVAAERALSWAVELQRSGAGGVIRLIHVVDPIPMPVGLEAPAAVVSEEDVEGMRHDLLALAREHGAEAIVDVVFAPDVAEAILETARACHVGLTVMGTHGRTGLGRLLLGSVAERVLRHADCPVLTIRAPQSG